MTAAVWNDVLSARLGDVAGSSNTSVRLLESLELRAV